MVFWRFLSIIRQLCHMYVIRWYTNLTKFWIMNYQCLFSFYVNATLICFVFMSFQMVFLNNQLCGHFSYCLDLIKKSKLSNNWQKKHQKINWRTRNYNIIGENSRIFLVCQLILWWFFVISWLLSFLFFYKIIIFY